MELLGLAVSASTRPSRALLKARRIEFFVLRSCQDCPTDKETRPRTRNESTSKMFKHLHTAHRRSLNLLGDSSQSASSSEIPLNNSSSSISSEGTYKKKEQKSFNRSVRFRKKTPREGTAASKINKKNERALKTQSTSFPERKCLTVAGRQSVYRSSMRKFMQQRSVKPIGDWTIDDACDWLKSNQLDDDSQLSTQFRDMRISGVQLADPENAWNCMNELSFQSDRQKQDVLLKLAECLRESKSAQSKSSSSETPAKHPKFTQRIRPPSSLSHSDSLMSSSDYVSGSSSSSATMPSVSSSEQLRSAFDEPRSSTGKNASKKVKKTFNNIKQVMTKAKSNGSPSSDPIPTNTMHSIVIHSDLNQQGCFVTTRLQITETTTTSEMIQLFLDSASVSDDINLFMLNDVTVPDSDLKEKKLKSRNLMSSRRLLEPDECPLAVYKSISQSTRRNVIRRLELTQVKGVVVKVICRIGQHRARGKQFRMSKQSSVDHVIRLALRKFRLRNVDASLFSLCEITVSGDVVELPQSCAPQWKNGTSLLVCDRATLRGIKSGAENCKPDFKRSCSTASNWSSESKASSDSWMPYKLDKADRLTEELVETDREDMNNGRDQQDSSTDDVTVEDVVPLDIGDRISPTTQLLQQKCLQTYDTNGDTSMEQQRADALCVDNAMLRTQMREKDEQFEDMHRKVSQVRQMLESGLQRYHDAAYQQADLLSGSSLEDELKCTEEQIGHTEDLLGQLFRHQRQLLMKQKQLTCTSSSEDEQKVAALTSADFDAVDSAILADVDLQIAVHQADLLSLKHKYQVLDMKMSLFIAQRKAEKFRQMIHGSLYNIVQSQSARNGLNENQHAQFASENSVHEIVCCELQAGKSGYGLALKDEVETTRNNSRLRGTIVDCDHYQSVLMRGDRLLEVNGVNVQSVGADFVARILKETTAARLVVMRRNNSDKKECICNLDLPKNEQAAAQSMSSSTKSEDTDDDDVIMRDFDGTKPTRMKTEEMADWREMTALKSDLSMLMRELEVTSRAKRELERDLARKRNRDVVLESENQRLKDKIAELTKSCHSNESDSA